MSFMCKICGGEHRSGEPIYLPLCYQRGYARLKTELAAAEERGRRRGVEETLKRAIQLFPDTAHDNNAWIREFIAALAPRDSAPACDCDAPMTGGHWSTCATRKPRDSGKEG